MSISNGIDFKQLNERLLERKSIRTYGDKYPTNEQVKEIETFIKTLNEIETPFKGQVRLCLQTEDFSFIKTFGFITGSKYWIYGVIPLNNVSALKQFGYLFQLLVLKCTSLGLSTVWLGGTFTVSAFNVLQYDKNKEFIPCVSPVGFNGNGNEFLARTIGSRNRKLWNELFYWNSFNTPLTKELLQSPFNENIFESIRWAPSARNLQEWRIVLTDQNQLHFFTIDSSWKEIDLGICVAQATVVLEANDIKGEWIVLDSHELINSLHATDLQYVISFITQK
ncbi:hypothetical protein EHI8A_198380 [Entamoeba histolytica HM-1:IMSS-B]|uniref:Nitroreductase, putative n=7 Tax=Entamoeba histolytica TaxID=5759 RepID=M2S2A2_ENTHI|nr:hypothetical protein EHI_085370 [Entamoeba histolytica HM-1:IMSS]EMD45436.1 nitroreductase, putative [Entamoeba histolytica KU27]EMH78266.1 hypothetical protein EHI8A_198380 [Entamoeba histolytica HM-1:IMSS-B]EMS12836.1 nitroreductase, putative [Entamoeba histolytica HM-3:IMSS]ENY64785.1 nitroreductase, putative [Entamoeba histolytica HM-1:IMSS-A]BAN37616.1 hypothetical protein [Entamoeba histolytica]|eukprot:XP_648004.1 hypothetical protein EHI_085370 [Entamoeba histolytica HM-1:IMSS]